jgi:hypothetical protein
MADTENRSVAIRLPGVGRLPELRLELSKTQEAEARLHEAQQVNPATYANLEYCYNESWRELKRAYAAVTYRLDKANEEIENIKAEILLDKWPEYIKDKPKSFDNMDMRKAYIQQQKPYLDATDHRDQVKAIEILIESRMKTMERTCAYMKKQMSILERTGGMGLPVGSTLKKF